MDSKTFFDNFEIIANAPGGIAQLRKLICDLAVSGKLVKQDAKESHSQILLDRFGKDSRSNSLEDSWIVAPLLECAEIFNGNSTDATTKTRLSKNVSGRPFIATKDVGHGFQSIDYRNGLRVTSSDTGFKIAPTGSVLICLEGGSAGRKMGLLDEDVSFGNKLFACITKEWVDAEFLLVSFLSTNFQSSFASGMSGIIGGISKKKFGEILIPIPPLKEQKRIILKVHELMQLCDQLEAAQHERDSLRTAARKSAIDAISTATTPEELDAAWIRISDNWLTIADTPESVASLRSLILDLAIHGLLSDPNVEFETVTMGDIFDVTGGLQKTPKRTPVLSHFPYLRVANVQRGRLDLAEISRFELSNDELEKYRLSPRDLLIVEGNGSEKEIGRCALWNGEIQDCIHQNHIIRCRPKLPEVEKYALLFLNSPSGTRLMKSLAVTTSGLFTLSVGKIKTIELQIPPVSEIIQIVRKVDELTSLCDKANSALLKRNELSKKIAGAITAEVAT